MGRMVRFWQGSAGPAEAHAPRQESLLCPSQTPAMGLFFRQVLGGYMRATRYKTPYRWLHGGYTDHQKKNPATFSIAGFLLLAWCRRDESNTRPSHYEFSPADKAKKYWKHSERKLLSLLKFPHSAVAVDATQPPAQRSMRVPALCHADRPAVPVRSRGPPVPATNRDTA